jgi:hypothetical protein
MEEIKSLRSLNTKFFGNKAKVHIGHIHYFDKLDSGRYREIDWSLVWDEEKKGWGFKYHSFRPFFPEYSDGVTEFRDLFDDKDQTIKYRAISTKVKGELFDVDEDNPNFDNNTNNKGVLYKNAFGDGIDYLLYNTRSTMVKAVKINNPKEMTEDAVFEWEVDLPKENNKELDVYRTLKKEHIKEQIGNAYKLDIDKEKEFDSGKQTLIGKDNKEKEGFTYLKTFRAWDSEGNTVVIKTKLYLKDGKRILRKTIPLEFLKNAEGKVFADTTTSYYAGAGDGSISHGTASWDSIHDATTGSSAFPTDSEQNQARARLTGGNFQIARSFFPFDTSSLPDGDTISSATLTISVASVTNQDSGTAYDYITVIQTSQASSSTLTTADYDQCGAVDNPTEGIDSGNRVDLSNISAPADVSFALNSTGIGWISKTGTTLLGVRTGFDTEDVAPSTGDNRIYGYFSEQTGTDDDPILEVIHASDTTTSTSTTTTSSSTTTTTSSTTTTTTTTSSSTSTSTTTTSSSTTITTTSSSTTTTTTSSSTTSTTSTSTTTTSSSTTSTDTTTSTSTTTTSSSTSTTTTSSSTSSTTSLTTSTSTTTTSSSTSSTTSTTTSTTITTTSSSTTTTTSTTTSTSTTTTLAPCYTVSDFITKLRRKSKDFPTTTSEKFSGDGVAVIFRTNKTPIVESSYTVVVDGVTKTETTDYTVDLETGDFTFTSAPSSDTDNVVITYNYARLSDNSWLDIINSVVAELRFKIWQEGVDETTLTTVANQDEYELDDISDQIFKVLGVWTRSSSNVNWRSLDTETNVTYHRDRNVINVRPYLQSSGYEMKVRYLKFYDMFSTTADCLVIPEEYREPIVYYCLVRYLDDIVNDLIVNAGATVRQDSYEPLNNLLNLRSRYEQQAEKILLRVKPRMPSTKIPTMQLGIKS